MKKYTYLRVLITVLVVILGIGGIGWFTWHLGKIFVGLVSASETVEQQQVEQTHSEILTLPEINLWICQVGVYNDKEKADLLIQALQVKGWKAQIIREEPYTVAIGAFEDKVTASLQGSRLTEYGIETWVKEEQFPALHYKVSGNNVERITIMLRIANSLLSGMEIEKVRQELAGDAALFSMGGCPTDYQRLNDVLHQIFNKEYAPDKMDQSYRQDLLELFVQYKEITTNTFKKYK